MTRVSDLLRRTIAPSTSLPVSSSISLFLFPRTRFVSLLETRVGAEGANLSQTCRSLAVKPWSSAVGWLVGSLSHSLTSRSVEPFRSRAIIVSVFLTAFGIFSIPAIMKNKTRLLLLLYGYYIRNDITNPNVSEVF